MRKLLTSMFSALLLLGSLSINLRPANADGHEHAHTASNLSSGSEQHKGLS